MECPICGSVKVYYIRGKAFYRCSECGHIWKSKGGCSSC